MKSQQTDAVMVYNSHKGQPTDAVIVYDIRKMQ